MSRNLCRTDCYFCSGEVRLDEPEREITRADCGGYYDTHDGYGYAGARVANASCVDCLARYIAWIDLSRCVGDRRGMTYWHRSEDGAFCDLSFRSTFNDEPGVEDMPRYQIEVRRVRVGPWMPTPWREGADIADHYGWGHGPKTCKAHDDCRSSGAIGAACWSTKYVANVKPACENVDERRDPE